MVRVLIIVATKNREELLPSALGSILNQEYKNWNLIIIDDNSTDKTPNIINYYSKLDSRINTVKNQDNKPFILLRQELIFKASEEYLAFLDDDDLWDTNYLKEMVNYLDSNKNLVQVYCNFRTIDEKGKIVKHLSNKSYPFPDTLPSALLIRTKLFKEMGGWDLTTFSFGSNYIHGEADFYIRAKQLNAIEHLPKDLVLIRKNNNSMSASRQLNIFGVLALMKKWKKLLIKDRSLWAKYYSRVGIHCIEAAAPKTGRAFLKISLKIDPLNTDTLGALILVSINPNLFLRLYKIYRNLTGR